MKYYVQPTQDVLYHWSKPLLILVLSCCVKVRGYLTSNDEGWSYWIDERCLLNRILAGDTSPQVVHT
eukprot:105837-Amphidinium_carterae.1